MKRTIFKVSGMKNKDNFVDIFSKDVYKLFSVPYNKNTWRRKRTFYYYMLIGI